MEIRHTAARSLDTEQVGDGFYFFFKCAVPNRCSLRNRGPRDVDIHVHTHLYCSKHDIYSHSRRKQVLERVPSPFSIRSRHNQHSSSMQQQQQQQRQRYRGSSPPRARLEGQRQDPQRSSHQRLRRLRPSCSLQVTIKTNLLAELKHQAPN